MDHMSRDDFDVMMAYETPEPHHRDASRTLMGLSLEKHGHDFIADIAELVISDKRSKHGDDLFQFLLERPKWLLFMLRHGWRYQSYRADSIEVYTKAVRQLQMESPGVVLDLLTALEEEDVMQVAMGLDGELIHVAVKAVYIISGPMGLKKLATMATPEHSALREKIGSY
jgi:hypothetical protein